MGVVVARRVPGRGFDRGGFVMRWKPDVVQSEKSDGSLVVTVGHPLVDAYLEFCGLGRDRTRSGRSRSI